jgi:hypothetical protein
MDSENIIIIIAILVLANLIVSSICLYQVKDETFQALKIIKTPVPPRQSGSMMENYQQQRTNIQENEEVARRFAQPTLQQKEQQKRARFLEKNKNELIQPVYRPPMEQ